jgi:hypothetical protein
MNINFVSELNESMLGGGGTVSPILNIKRSRGFPLTPKKLYSCHSLNKLVHGTKAGLDNLQVQKNCHSHV